MLIYWWFILNYKVLVTDATQRPRWEKDQKRLFAPHTHDLRKIKRTCTLAHTAQPLVSWFQTLLRKDEPIWPRWRHEKYYSKFHPLNAAPFNLFYCLEGGKGMFVTVCETRSGAKLMLMGILRPEPHSEACVCAHSSWDLPAFTDRASLKRQPFPWKLLSETLHLLSPLRMQNLWIKFSLDGTFNHILKLSNVQVLLKE